MPMMGGGTPKISCCPKIDVNYDDYLCGLCLHVTPTGNLRQGIGLAKTWAWRDVRGLHSTLAFKADAKRFFVETLVPIGVHFPGLRKR